MRNSVNNLILQTDSYKVTHFRQYPPGSQFVHSYLEARGGEYPSTVFFGLQYYLYTLLGQRETQFVTALDIEEADAFFHDHFGTDVFNRAGWEHIVKVHGGRLPVRIRAVPEGTVVPVSNVLMTVENTDPAVPWLTNYIETRLMQVWYPITVATLSRNCRQIILKALDATGDPSLIDFKLHDFGYRGSTSDESAAIGGLAHLVNFKGTDTMAALVAARKFYGEKMAGFSIPAAEHSTITSWGQEHEVDAFRNMLRQYPTGLVAVVSDSYDIYAACEHLWGEVLRDEVLARPGTLVIRPDSGHPPTVVRKCLAILGEKFGYSTNFKGYKVLDPHVRLIQGDGVNPDSIREILATIASDGWSADNIAFGMGGALLQKVNRDTCQFAFKASNIVVDGVDRPVHKKPATMESKQSKPGRLTLYRHKETGELWTGDPSKWNWIQAVRPSVEVMQTVYQDGVVINPTTLADVRARAL
jgi:nicotinamide phosphoribosyltransferase